MPSWPGDLPSDFLFEGYEESFANLALVTEMDAGPAKRRRRFTAGVKPLGGSMSMTSVQLATLETFYYATIGVVSPFDIKHPRLGTTISARFTEPPAITPRGPGFWSVNIKLEQMP